jgi:acyl-CoA thioester hydrolase
MPAIHRHDFAVPAGAIDANGHVNNVQYVSWMQDAAERHALASGCARATQAAGATWVVRVHRIEYFRPAFGGERISVLTWVSSFRRVRSLRRYRFFRVADETLLAEGETEWIFVDARTGHPRSAPAEVMGAFEIVGRGNGPRGLGGIPETR